MSQPGKTPTRGFVSGGCSKGWEAAVLRDGVYLLPYCEPCSKRWKNRRMAYNPWEGTPVEPITEVETNSRGASLLH